MISPHHISLIACHMLLGLATKSLLFCIFYLIMTSSTSQERKQEKYVMALIDSRLVRLAQVLVRYSLNVQPGNLVAIHGGIEAIPLLSEVYREVLRAGGHPQFNLEVEEAREIYLKEANEEQLDFV